MNCLCSGKRFLTVNLKKKYKIVSAIFETLEVSAAGKSGGITNLYQAVPEKFYVYALKNKNVICFESNRSVFL